MNNKTSDILGQYLNAKEYFIDSLTCKQYDKYSKQHIKWSERKFKLGREFITHFNIKRVTTDGKKVKLWNNAKKLYKKYLKG